VVSGSGPNPQEGALRRSAVQIRPPRQRDLPILEGPFYCGFGFGTEPSRGCFAKAGGPNPPAPTKGPSDLGGSFFIAVSASGPSPQEGALRRSAVQIRPPRQKDLPVLEGPFFIGFRVRDRALKRVLC